MRSLCPRCGRGPGGGFQTLSGLRTTALSRLRPPKGSGSNVRGEPWSPCGSRCGLEFSLLPAEGRVENKGPRSLKEPSDGVLAGLRSASSVAADAAGAPEVSVRSDSRSAGMGVVWTKETPRVTAGSEHGVPAAIREVRKQKSQRGRETESVCVCVAGRRRRRPRSRARGAERGVFHPPPSCRCQKPQEDTGGRGPRILPDAGTLPARPVLGVRRAGSGSSGQEATWGGWCVGFGGIIR